MNKPIQVKPALYTYFFAELKEIALRFLAEGDYLIENKVVFFKPYVTIVFADGKTKILDFMTYDQALAHGKKK